MVEIRIKFCQCDHLPRAVEMTEELLKAYSGPLKDNFCVSLVPTDCGPCRYNVSIDGKPLSNRTLKAIKDEIDRIGKLKR